MSFYYSILSAPYLLYYLSETYNNTYSSNIIDVAACTAKPQAGSEGTKLRLWSSSRAEQQGHFPPLHPSCVCRSLQSPQLGCPHVLCALQCRECPAWHWRVARPQITPSRSCLLQLMRVHFTFWGLTHTVCPSLSVASELYWYFAAQQKISKS